VTWYRHDASRNVLMLALHVQPNARRSQFAGLHGGRLKVRLAAPAIDGKANALLVDFLAESFQLPARRVIISQGGRSRAKVVQIVDAGPELLARISHLADDDH
jgi:uncharacterized protein (TIGR00251 family)